MPKELSKFIDPAVIITIIVSFSYFIGWTYSWGFFARLGIQYASLNLPASFYLGEAFWAFLAISTIVMSLLFIIKDFKEFQNRYLPTFTLKILSIVLFLLISFFSSTYLGEYHAKALVEGEINDLFMINS